MFRLADSSWETLAMDHPVAHRTDRFMLWVDAVGGFWVCLADELILGQPAGPGTVDIPILADISSRHARIRRDGEGYLIEAIRDVYVDGRPVDKVAALGHGSKIGLGQRVRLRLRRPHALSATARLDFDSHHRTYPSADAVLLMADSCVLGPHPCSHIVCPDWPQEVVIYRHDEELYCRTAGSWEIDSVRCKGRGRLTRNSRVEGEGFSLRLEEIAA
jgi:hypothetical protein